MSGKSIEVVNTDAEGRLVLADGIAFVPQGRLVFPEMTVLENLEFMGQVFGLSGDDRRRRIGERVAAPGVTVVEWWDFYVGSLPERLVVVEFVIETVDLRTLTLTFSGAALEPLARALGGEGIEVITGSHHPSEYGKFAWIKDGEGNRIELWEPPKGG